MDASAIVKYGQGTALGAVEGLAKEDWTTVGVCGEWSVKDIVAHLASYEIVLAEVLETIEGDGPTPTLDRFTAPNGNFNETEVAARREQGVAEILAEFAEAHTRVTAALTALPTELLRQPGTLPWYGADYAIDDFIVYAYYGHKREHAAQIAAFRDRLGRE